uniref:HAT C-terminal dimerisation domain-containing protein n=1 Tax=Cyprinus carpio TaxID=7962 RepID=A0A8C2HU02_CYPCA
MPTNSVGCYSASGQSAITSFFHAGPQGIYDTKHPRQKAISDALVKDVIISCCLPLSMVDNEDFRHFLHVLDPQYRPIARSTISSVTIPGMVKVQKEWIKCQLAEASSVAVTTDIWSDCKMRSFLGVTAHTVTEVNHVLSLQSYLLTCERVHGKHTGEKIAMMFECCAEEYLIKNKINFVITDNASNMRKAFQARFLPEEDEAAEPEPEDEICQDLTPEDQEMQRLSCFTHSLQLVIKDGLKEASGLSGTLSKLSRAANLLHSGTSFKDYFEANFGDATIPTANATRWNSTLKQVKAYVNFDIQMLAYVLDSEGHKSLILSQREYAQLKELIEVLDPFLEATNLTQGEKTVTVSVVVPCVLTLHSHLQEIRERVRYCGPLVRALENSMKARGPTKFPFTIAYFVASVLDPAFGFQWLEHDVHLFNNIFIKYQHKVKFPALYQLATQVFCIPATSAPIERVFSHGGILMRPHRARLSSTMLSNLMLLKCNMKTQHD